MFETIFELPSQVRSSLDEKDQEVFRNAYNAEEPKTEAEVREAMKKAWRACKDLPSSFSFRIVASVEDVDKDREIIDLDSVKEHMDRFIEYGGNIQNDHHNYQLGTIWDWEPHKCDGKKGLVVWGNLFGGDDVFDEARRAFVKGTNNLSIAGEADRGKFQCDDKGCYTRRNVTQLLEISLCDVPANRHCKLQWYNEKANFTKSADPNEISLDVSEYTIHKDYTMCPTQKLKRQLLDAGFDAHARWDGVFIPTDDTERTGVFAKSCGLLSEPVNGGVLLNSRDALIERFYKDGISKGYMDDAGNLTRHITKSQFLSMERYGLLVRDGNLWSLAFPDFDDDCQ